MSRGTGRKGSVDRARLRLRPNSRELPSTRYKRSKTKTGLIGNSKKEVKGKTSFQLSFNFQVMRSEEFEFAVGPRFEDHIAEKTNKERTRLDRLGTSAMIWSPRRRRAWLSRTTWLFHQSHDIKTLKLINCCPRSRNLKVSLFAIALCPTLPCLALHCAKALTARNKFCYAAHTMSGVAHDHHEEEEGNP